MSSASAPSIEVFWNQTCFSLAASEDGLFREALCVIADGLGPETEFSLLTSDVPLFLYRDNTLQHGTPLPLSYFGLQIERSQPSLAYGAPEASGLPSDQRRLWTYDVRVAWPDPLPPGTDWYYQTDPSPFQHRLILQASNGASCAADDGVTLRLAPANDFWMRDVDPYLLNPPWLSSDTRVFRVLQGANMAVGSTIPFPNGPLDGDPVAWFGELLRALGRASQDVINGFFEALPLDSTDSALSLLPSENGVAVHNFVMTRLRLAQDTTLEIGNNVRAFFRLFRALNTNLAYDATAPAPVYYPRGGLENGPLPGRSASTSGEVVSVPFFADYRPIDWETNPPRDDLNRFPGGTTVAQGSHLVGAYLDINQPESPISGYFQSQSPCLVVELVDPRYPIPLGATPTTSGSLAQRNLSIQNVTNPGLPEFARRVEEVFEFVPWTSPGRQALRAAPKPSSATASFYESPYLEVEGASLDRLVFRANDVPRGTEVEVYMPGVPLARLVPRGGRILASDRVALPLDRVAELTIPLRAGMRAAAMVAIQLPSRQDVGHEYVVDVLQVHTKGRRIVGAFRLRLPVYKARVALSCQLREEQLARYQLEHAAPSFRDVLARRLDFAGYKTGAVGHELIRDYEELGQWQSLTLERIDGERLRDAKSSFTVEVLDGGRLIAKRALSGRGPHPLYEGRMIDSLRLRFRERHGKIVEEQDWSSEQSKRNPESAFVTRLERSPSSKSNSK